MDDQMDDEIEFNVQTFVPAELDYVRDSLTRGQASANGAYSRQVRQLLQAETGAAEVLLTTSCTAALELSAMLLDLQPGEYAGISFIPDPASGTPHVHLGMIAGVTVR